MPRNKLKAAFNKVRSKFNHGAANPILNAVHTPISAPAPVPTLSPTASDHAWLKETLDWKWDQLLRSIAPILTPEEYEGLKQRAIEHIKFKVADSILDPRPQTSVSAFSVQPSAYFASAIGVTCETTGVRGVSNPFPYIDPDDSMHFAGPDTFAAIPSITPNAALPYSGGTFGGGGASGDF